MLEEYVLLSNAKDSQGIFLADETMRNNMDNFYLSLTGSLSDFDSTSQELFLYIENGGQDQTELQSLLNSLEKEAENFRTILGEDKTMEMRGANLQQSKLQDLERLGEYLFSLFTVAEIGMMMIIILFLTSTLKRNITKLTNITHQISSKKLTAKIQFKESNEFTPLADNIAMMQEKLHNSQKAVLRSQKLSTIGELASRLSHDLRNPLSVIKNANEILSIRLQNSEDRTLKEQIEFTRRAVNRMTHQVENVLDFVKMRPLMISNSNILHTLELSLYGLNIPKGITLVLPKGNIQAECDHYLLEIVFKNLIWNSVQAIQGSGKIEVTCKQDNSNILMEFKDSGQGISDENLNKVFDPLFTTKQHGTGLGLPSCKSIIESHGGRIFVKNKPTRFYVEIPKTHSELIPATHELNEKFA